MIYCFLQLLSLLLLVFTLRRMVGLSPIRQIAFVLEKQVAWVQMSLIFWLFYNVQGSLEHLGQQISMVLGPVVSITNLNLVSGRTGYDYTLSSRGLRNRQMVAVLSEYRLAARQGRRARGYRSFKRNFAQNTRTASSNKEDLVPNCWDERV
ncbi:hypothetical protein PR003_g19365 [Phytophthora rubi]|uniref:Uncharacterized protein n=1 Tax=Phytophthora rubi TaxID=129364 RepID=A0A6A4DTD2_9STRA|nr:hypothetical protein PR002_g18714 [Phytophthora rubi]KAE9017762.1 hypothetical protein PR001_g14310 [Phytophthora rubi]KAE9313951.1 hypothetical protein PR003_g19365 [Phytophthora rubi]